MSKPLYVCRCCFEPKPTASYLPGFTICANCATLSANDAVNKATDNWESKSARRAMTKATRQARRRERILAKYHAQGGKPCTSCRGILPFTEPASAFGVSESRTDGLQPECKACARTRNAILTTPGGTRETWYAVRDAMRARHAAARPASTAPITGQLAPSEDQK